MIYICNICGEQLPSLDSLLYHFWTVHRWEYVQACAAVGCRRPHEPRGKRWAIFRELKRRNLALSTKGQVKIMWG